MKKILCVIISVFMIFSALPVFSDMPISVYLNGIIVPFDQEPQIINDRTFVPVRAIFEAMGATIDWKADTQTVTSVLGDKTVEMTIGKNVISVNGTKETIDAAPQIIGGRTLVPARAVSESFDCTVEWSQETRSVIIRTADFIKKCETAKKYSSVETLTHGEQSALSAFGVMYLDGFDVATDSPDGTKIDLGYDSETFHANLNIRADVYTGATNDFTEEYVKGVADGMVDVVSGNLISYSVVTLSNVDFMKIEYTAPRTVSGIADSDSEITVYMGIKNGVVYTATLSCYGEASRGVIEDLHYTINSILIA